MHRASRLHLPTLRKAPAEAKLASHQLLVRGGFIRPLAAGVFSYLPLGFRVLQRVVRVVREEMDRAGAQEVLLPILNPGELWRRTGRWESFRPPLMKLEVGGADFCLGPTHEEPCTDLAAADMASYRQLPMTLYQITPKFRNELRPRGGLVRAREFIMKDAYSFDADHAGLDASYQAMYDAYVRILERLQLPTAVVQADAGSMGGWGTLEFMLATPDGEDTLYLCSQCDYAANAECATSPPAEPVEPPADGQPQRVETPNARTVEEVCRQLGCAPALLVKTLLFRAGDAAGDGRFVAALVRGDRELNETKLANQVRAAELRMANVAEIEEATKAPQGFSGPVGLPAAVAIIADPEVLAMRDFVVGANQADAHLTGVNHGRDFRVDEVVDLRQAVAGDRCPRCGQGELQQQRGIELAHVFKLGTKYAEDLGAVFADQEGHERPAVMGCYGFGISRAIAALVESWHDQDGIVWPLAAAPYDVAVLVLDLEPALLERAEQLAAAAEQHGFEVLMDDRDLRPGVKFKDADLIGYPLQVVVGRRARDEGLLEVRRRRDREERVVPVEGVPEALRELAEGA